MVQELRNSLVRWKNDLFRPPRRKGRGELLAQGRWLWAVWLALASTGLFYFLTILPLSNPGVDATLFAAMGLGLWMSVLLRSIAELLPENMNTLAGFLRLTSGLAFAFGLISSLVLAIVYST
jgi:hypothetical protein